MNGQQSSWCQSGRVKAVAVIGSIPIFVAYHGINVKEKLPRVYVSMQAALNA